MVDCGILAAGWLLFLLPEGGRVRVPFWESSDPMLPQLAEEMDGHLELLMPSQLHHVNRIPSSIRQFMLDTCESHLLPFTSDMATACP